MSNGQISVGDDTPTGEPETGPRGPYITDKSDGSGKPGSKEDSDQRRGPDAVRPSRTETEITKKSELGSDRSGG